MYRFGWSTYCLLETHLRNVVDVSMFVYKYVVRGVGIFAAMRGFTRFREASQGLMRCHHKSHIGRVRARPRLRLGGT